MNARYKIHPESGHVAVTVEGLVSSREWLAHIQTVWSDPAWKSTFNGIIDFTNATLNMTVAEIEELTKAMEKDPRCSLARWALVVSTATSFAKLRHVDRVADENVTLRIFFDYRSAETWLLSPRMSPQAPSTPQ